MKNFKKVGVIEVDLGYPLRIAERYGSMEDTIISRAVCASNSMSTWDASVLQSST